MQDSSEQGDDRRALWTGFGDTLTRATEFAVVPLIFGGAGFWLDSRLGIVPVFTLILVVVAMVGLFAKLWYSYDAAMQAHEAASPWGGAKRPGGPSA